MKSTLRLAAATVAILTITATQADAGRAPRSEPVITCDQRGCSDWTGHRMAASGRQAVAHRPGRVAKAKRRRPALDANASPVRATTWVPTAAGIDIQVDRRLAAKAQGVIAELVAGGYKPRRITCLSHAPSHVKGSYHRRGGGLACDIDQRGWGLSPVPKDLMRAATARHGVRDGCEFRDHGHFDLGAHLPRARVLRNCGRAYADAIDGRRHVARD